MPVRLRGHHFLCILTFKGEGYTPDFTANMMRIVRKIGDGAPIELVDGSDDICAGLAAHCRGTQFHQFGCDASETQAMDRLAIAEISKALGRPPTHCAPLGRDDIALLRRAFAAGTIRGACHLCRWKSLCDTISNNEFHETCLP